MSTAFQAIAKYKKGFGIAAALLLLSVITFSYFKTPDFSDLTGQLTGDVGSSKGKISILTPKVGDAFATGNTLSVKWASVRAAMSDKRALSSLQVPVDLYLQPTTGGKPIAIVKRTIANPYSYAIPQNLTGSYRVALSSSDGNAVSGVFEIKKPTPSPTPTPPTTPAQPPQPAVGTLTVSRDSTFPATDFLTNAQDNTLIGFYVVPTAEDVRGIQLDFSVAKNGPLGLGDYRLYTSEVQNSGLTLVASQSGTTFSAPNVVLHRGRGTFFYLKASVVVPLSPAHNGVQTFLWSVRGTRATSDAVIDQTSGLPLARTLGDMTPTPVPVVATFTQETLPRDSLADGEAVELLKFRVAATNGDVLLKSVAFNVNQNGNYTVQNYRLFKGADPITTFNDTTSTSNFMLVDPYTNADIGHVVIASGTSQIITLKAAVSGIQVGGNESVTASLSAATQVRLTNMVGGAAVTPTPDNFLFNSLIENRTTVPTVAPTVQTFAGSAQGPLRFTKLPSSTTLINSGENTVRFNVDATGASGFITSLAFDTAWQSTGSTPLMISNYRLSSSDSNDAPAFSNDGSFAVNFAIPSGTSKTFTLLFTVSGAAMNDSVTLTLSGITPTNPMVEGVPFSHTFTY